MNNPAGVDQETDEQLDSQLSTRGFLLALTKTLVVLAASALLLIAGYVSVATWQADHFYFGSSKEKILKGSEFNLRIGSGQAVEERAMAISRPSADERALLTHRLKVEASDYPFIEVDMAGRHAGLAAYVIWRTEDKPQEQFHRRIYWQGRASTTLNMSTHESWTGEIYEIGIDIYGEFRDDHVTVSEVTMLPYSSRNLISTIWSQWSTFGGWKLESINHLKPDHGQLLSPVVAVAAWMALSIMMLTLPRVIKPGHRIVAYVTAFLIPWIMLDLLWQRELSLQLGETQYVFGGKTTQEKHLADVDAGIYASIQRLKTKMPPHESSRIFILSNSKGHDFTRLKAQYYLFPKNSYNYGKYPPGRGVRAGDYILALTPSSQLRFDDAKQRLSWKNGPSLPVKRVNEDWLGTLYQVLEPTPINREVSAQGAGNLE